MANDRWRNDDRQRWSPDRERGGSDHTMRQGYGYDERQNFGRDDDDLRAFGEGDYRREDLGPDPYGSSYGTGSYGGGFGRQGYQRYEGGADRSRDWSVGHEEPDFRQGSGYDRDRPSSYGSDYYGSSSSRYAGMAEWPAPMSPSPMSQGRGGYREDWRRAQDDYRNQRSQQDYRGQHELRGDPSDQRGWWDRTMDEVRSWMGDEEANRRRQMDSHSEYDRDPQYSRRGHYGRGPRGYMRSDQRILEDINDRLTDDWLVDATEIQVAVTSCEVTLTGTVDSRDAKRRAENIAADVSGVRDVQNNLRVRQQTYQSGNLTGSSSAALEQTTGLSSGTPKTSSPGQTH